MPKPLPGGRRFAIVAIRPFIPNGRCSQGGAKFPTGGKGLQFSLEERPKPASAFFPERSSPELSSKKKGQQIRCNSEADG
jgi:hypothetical protein